MESGQKLLAWGKSDNRVKPPDKKKILAKRDKTKVFYDSKSKSSTSNNKRFWGIFSRKKKQTGGDDDEADFTEILVKDISQTTCETWVTFLFTFCVGSFLLGGGAYLIYNGLTNDVVDFVVLGSVGVLMGVCFSSVGSFLVFKPVYHSYMDRKKRMKELQLQRQEEKTDQLPSYFTDAQTKIMTVQIANQLVDRRPSNSELYGGTSETDLMKLDVRPGNKIAFVSNNTYELPPKVALPKKNSRLRDDSQPVMLLDFRQSTTDDDVFAISEAAEKKNVVSGQKRDKILSTSSNTSQSATRQTEPTISEVSPESSPPKLKSGQTMLITADISPEPTPTPDQADSGTEFTPVQDPGDISPEPTPKPDTLVLKQRETRNSRVSSTSSTTILCGPHERDGSPLPDVETIVDQDDNNNKNYGKKMSQTDNNNKKPVTSEIELLAPDDTPANKKSALIDKMSISSDNDSPTADSPENSSMEKLSKLPQNSSQEVDTKPRPGQINVEVLVHSPH